MLHVYGNFRIGCQHAKSIGRTRKVKVAKKEMSAVYNDLTVFYL